VIVDILPHDQAVLDALGTVGLEVGFAEAPAGALDGVRERTGGDYIVLYPIVGSRRSSSLDSVDDDADLIYQTTIVAREPEGARARIADIEAALAAVAIPGRVVVRVTPAGTGDVRPDPDVKPAVFIATPRWRLWTTPATPAA